MCKQYVAKCQIEYNDSNNMLNICRKYYICIRFFKNECNVANTILQTRDKFNLAAVHCCNAI